MGQVIVVFKVPDLTKWSRVADLEIVVYCTPIGRLRFLWLGPAGFVTGPFAGTSPYIDWFLETFYTHPRPWKN